MGYERFSEKIFSMPVSPFSGRLETPIASGSRRRPGRPTARRFNKRFQLISPFIRAQWSFAKARLQHDAGARDWQENVGNSDSRIEHNASVGGMDCFVAIAR